MHIFPTNEETELAADLLVNRYSVSAQLLGQLFGKDQRDQANSILQALGRARLTPLDIARLLVQREGPALFANSSALTRKLRLHLLQQLRDEQLQALFDRHGNVNRSISSPGHMQKPLATKKWHSGKHWARDFVAALGFPDIFASVAQTKSNDGANLHIPCGFSHRGQPCKQSTSRIYPSPSLVRWKR